MYKRGILLFLISNILIAGICCARNNRTHTLVLKFIPTIHGKNLQINKSVVSQDDSISITEFRFYISGIRLIKDGALVLEEINSDHLIDAEDTLSQVLHILIPEGITYNGIQFNLGIDSATSCSGAYGGDLDPALGMYWAWQSGYINLKLEGNLRQISKPVADFKYHLGGYHYPDCAMQMCTLKTTSSDTISISADPGRFLDLIDIRHQSLMMIPGHEAAVLSRKAIQMFQVLR